MFIGQFLADIRNRLQLFVGVIGEKRILPCYQIFDRNLQSLGNLDRHINGGHGVMGAQVVVERLLLYAGEVRKLLDGHISVLKLCFQVLFESHITMIAKITYLLLDDM